MNYDFNPSGSFMAVEAITSKDGRILGKMDIPRDMKTACSRM